MSKNFLVYKSSAGSGKTFVLAKTFLSVALSKTQPEHFSHILAITFTVKAAAEMKQRIIRYLSEISSGKEDASDTQAMKALLGKELSLDEPQLREKCAALLSTILHNYGQFSVLTIDKFVNRLVRSFASDLGFTSDFEIELDVQRLAVETVERLLQEVGENEDVSALLLAYLHHQVENDRSWKIETPLTELATHLSSEQFYFHSQRLEGLTARKVFELKKSMDEQVRDFQRTVSSIGREALTLIEQHGLSADDFYRKNTGIAGYFRKAATLEFDKLMEPNSYVRTTVEEDKWYTGNENAVIDAIRPQLLQSYRQLERLMEKAGHLRFLEALSTTLFSLGLINELRACFEAVKAEENVQLLGDFYQTISTNILEERAPFIYERIGNRYKHLLIDEFQDTSLLQWHSFLPLIENALSENHLSLVVGDVKQSIYRFRGGEPELFQSLDTDSAAVPSFLRHQLHKETLNVNYRSSPTIVDFNNRFFKALTPRLLNEDRLDLYADFHQQAVKTGEGWVESRLLPEDDPAAWYDQVETWITHNVQQRGYSYRDICILFHRNDHASDFATELLGRNIPVVSDESLLLVNDIRVQAILATLEAAQSGSDLFALVRWFAKLEQVRALRQDLHHAIRTLQREKHPDFNRAAKVAGIELLDHRLRSGTTCEQILQVVRTLALDEHDPFIRKLLDFALDYEHKALYLKTPFLQHWNDAGPSLSIDLAPGNAVRIMSIHKSKGLQFPIVILPLYGCKFSKLTNDKAWISLDEHELGIKTALMDVQKLRNTPLEAVYEEEVEKSRLDQLNVLYVALTRAEEKMYLLSKVPARKNHWIDPPELEVLATLEEWDHESQVFQIGNDRKRSSSEPTPANRA